MKHFHLTTSKALRSLLLACLLTAGGTAWADELTVSNGTATNQYVPLYGYYADTQGGISEFIISSNELTDLNGKEIEQMAFYLSSPATASFGTASFNVYLEEVEGSNYDDSSASQLTDSKTLVYAGALDATGTTMDIPFTNKYTYNGGNLLVAIEVGTRGTYTAASFYGTTTTSNTSRYKYGSSSGRAKFIPKTTFITLTEGAALSVKDGNTKVKSPYSYNFGLTTAGATKQFTLSNPGTESITLGISATGGFSVSPATTTIEAGAEATLTVTMADATGSGTVTITPTATDIEPFTINVSGTIRDANKIFIDFSDNPLPDSWSKDSYWTISDGKASIKTYYKGYITSGRIAADEGGESLIFRYARNYDSSYSPSELTVEYATTGNGTDADWKAAEGTTPDFEYNVWKDAAYTIPAAAKYIRIKGYYVDIDDIYGLTEVAVPIMEVTQPEVLDFGVIASAATTTFTIANTGKAALEGIEVTSDNAAFTISGAPTSLEPEATQQVTITMSADNIGSFSGKITVSAPDQTAAEFTVKGTVLPEGLTVIDFNNNKLPNDRWQTAGNYMEFSGGAAVFGSNYGGEATLTTPKIAMGQYLVLKVKLDYTSSASYHLAVKGSADNGQTYTYTKDFNNTVLTNDYQYLVLTDIPTNINKLQFQGYYASIDELQGIVYAPELAVTKDDETVASPATYDFGECTADADVTYSFTNLGEGTLSITGVAVSGDGAAAYTTNWTQSVAVPFSLVITRSYDADRNGADQPAVITVTTTDGDFVINVSGTDRAANAPQLALDTESLDFGKVAANGTKTVTVTNDGTGLMTVNLSSDNDLFTVTPAQLTDIAAGESQTFDVTFLYDQATTYGLLTANITVAPTYEGAEAKTIAATVNAKDPDTWFEHFDDAQVADRGWTIDSGWTVTDGMAVAGGSNSKYLTTPYLTVSSTADELTFDYQVTGSYTTFIYYYTKKDDGNWSSFQYISGTPGSSDTFTLTGLEPGTYQFRFSGSNFRLDNFEGLKRFIPEHDAEITTVGLPSTGFVGREYTATVTVREKLGKAETATAKLYIADEAVATAEATLTASGETTIDLTFTPSAAVSYQTAHIEVTYAGGTLKGESKYVTIKEVTLLDETAENTISAGSMKAVLLRRPFIAGWNTLCLPFSVISPKEVFGEDISAYTLSGYSDEDGLTFSAVNLSNGLDAGVPYLLYTPQAITDDLFFESVTLTANKHDATKGTVTFQGTYSPMEAGSLTGYYVVTRGENARIAKCSDKATLRAFRAYFVNDTADGNARMNIRFDDGTTGIAAMTSDGQLHVGTLYNLQGQRVQGRQKGLYIIDGKKVVR